MAVNRNKFKFEIGNISQFKYTMMKWFLLISIVISVIVGIATVIPNPSNIWILSVLIAIQIAGYVLNQYNHTTIAAYITFSLQTIALLAQSYNSSSVFSLNYIATYFIFLSIFQNERLNTILFTVVVGIIIIFTVIGKFSWTVVYIDGTKQPYPTAFIQIIPVLAFGYIISILISKVFIKSVNNEFESQENLAVTLRNIGDAVIATDIDGKIVVFNKVAEHLTGYSADSAIGCRFAEIVKLIDQNTRLPVWNPINFVISTGQNYSIPGNVVLVQQNGGERLIKDEASPIRERNSKIRGAVIVIRDITDQMMMEGLVFKNQQIQSISLLAGGIAHDFNNLLSGILGNVEILQMELEENADEKESLTEIQNAALSAKKLTQQLLHFSKGGVSFKEATSIKEILQKTARFALHGRNINLEMEFENPIWAVEVDRGQISQVIHNIILNASQAITEEGKISILVTNLIVPSKNNLSLLPGNYIKVEISDTGIGIPEDHLSEIFNPYFTTKTYGNGLGLAISYSIIERHNGTITVESEVGKGTTFTIYLKAYEGKAEVLNYFEEKEIAPSDSEINLLILEDEQSLRSVIEQVMKKLKYKGTILADGEALVSEYRAQFQYNRPYTGVILDLTVPGGIGGKEVMKRLRAIDPKVKGVISSGYGTSEIMQNYKKYGFIGRLVKPYNIKEFNNAILGLIK